MKVFDFNLNKWVDDGSGEDPSGLFLKSGSTLATQQRAVPYSSLMHTRNLEDANAGAAMANLKTMNPVQTLPKPAPTLPKPTTNWAAAQRNSLNDMAKYNDWLETQRNAAGQLAKTSTAADFLSVQGPLSPVQKAAGKQVLAAMEKQYNPQFRDYYRQAVNRPGQGQALPEHLLEAQKTMDALRNRVSGSRAFGMGAVDALSFGLAKKNDPDQVLATASRENPIAYGAGKFAGEGVKYAAAGAAVKAIPGVNAFTAKAGSALSNAAGGKISADVLQRLVMGRLVDLPADVLNAAFQTDSPEEFAKSLGVNQLQGLAFDSTLEGIGAAWRAIRKAKMPDALAQEANNVLNRHGWLNAETNPDPTAGGLLPDVNAMKATADIPLPNQDAVRQLPPEAVRNWQDVLDNLTPEQLEKLSEEQLDMIRKASATRAAAAASINETSSLEELYQSVYQNPKSRFNRHEVKRFQLTAPERWKEIAAQKAVAQETLKRRNLERQMLAGYDPEGFDAIRQRLTAPETPNTGYMRDVTRRDIPQQLPLDEDALRQAMNAGNDDLLNQAARRIKSGGSMTSPVPLGSTPDILQSFGVESGRLTDDDVYSGIVKTKNTDRGRQFWDIAEIKKEDALSATRGVNGNTPPPAMLGTSSSATISSATPNINGQNVENAVQNFATAGGTIPAKPDLKIDPETGFLVPDIPKSKKPVNIRDIVPDEPEIPLNPVTEQRKQEAFQALKEFEENHNPVKNYTEEGIPLHQSGFDAAHPPKEKNIDIFESDTPFDDIDIPPQKRISSGSPGAAGFPTSEELEAAEESIIRRITNKGINYAKDPSRNFDAASGGDPEVRQWMKENLERPFYAAKKEYAKAINDDLDTLNREIVQGMGIKKGSKESAAVQWFGEGQRFDKYGNAHPYTLANLAEEFPDSWRDIVAADAKFRKVYNDFYKRENAVLDKIYPAAEHEVQKQLSRLQDEAAGAGIRLAELQEAVASAPPNVDKSFLQEMEAEIVETRKRIRGLNLQTDQLFASLENGDALRNRRLPYRENYYHHFKEMESDFQGIWNILTASHEIDPNLVGVSDFTKPKSTWKGFMQKRSGGRHDADAVGGMLKYIPAVEYKINMDPVIADNRRFIELIQNDTEASRNANGFIEWMTDWTNGMAGKTNPIDRPFQKIANRKVMAVIDALNRRVKSNAVLGNLNSAINQIYNLPNAAGYLKNPADMAAGLGQWWKAALGDDEVKSLMKQSGFLEERYLDKAFDKFDEGLLADTKKFAKWLLNVGDEQSTRWTWLSAYEQAKRKGIADMVEYADDITRRSVGGRGVGEVPVMLQSRMVNLVAPFQLEVNNAFQSLKEHLGKKDALALAEIMGVGWLLNHLGEAVTGNRTALDPIHAVQEALAALPAFDQAQEEQPEDENALLGGSFGKSISKYAPAAALIGGRVAGEFLNAHPAGNFLASSLIPENYRKKFFGDNDPSRFGTGNIGIDTFAKPLYASLYNAVSTAEGSDSRIQPDWQSTILNTALPFGGRQLDRSIKAAQTTGLLPRWPWDQTGSTAPDLSASYSNSGQFRFPIRRDPLNMLQTLAFGPFASREGRQYLKDGRKPLSKDTTQHIQEAYNAGVAPEAFLKIRDTLNAFQPIRDDNGKITETALSQKRQALLDDASGLTPSQKQMLDNFLISSDGETKFNYASPEAFLVSGFSDSDKKKWDNLQKTGLPLNQFMSASGKYKQINAQENLSPQEKATSFRKWLDTQKISQAQHAALENEFAFWQMTRAQSKKYTVGQMNDKYQAAFHSLNSSSGFSENQFVSAVDALKDVKAEDRENTLMNTGLSAQQAGAFIKAVYQTCYSLGDLSDEKRQAFQTLHTRYGLPEDAFLSAYNLVKDIPGQKNANGKTISNSQKKARYKALRNLGWNHSQAVQFLHVTFGYADNGWS